ncbi:FHA domain-containing protein [Corallococcus llansteffanensis]|uniref:FHA domain-containing protein n=1 Tax=Corallococcus llansteffanensis TaxID=2316731 RepID=A0A3A8QBK2_9BACT|nr:FHA domain-containing protein [Corallococcus llansteffanensis]RKH66063.1 FHA domain-containing protein [Corallococcus llansteffanensis]
MAPPNPKRPPRPPRPPGEQASPDDPGEELPFDEDEVAPLQADDPRPQRVPQYPAGPRRVKRRVPGERTKSDRELLPRYDWQKEYSDPGLTPAFLYVERGPGVGQLVPLHQGSITLGRSSTSDLRLQHASISRRHAQLTRRGNAFTVRDLGSQNGTFVNRSRIKGEVEVRPGDELSLGNASLRLRGPGAAAATLKTALDPILPRRGKRSAGVVAVALAAAVVGSAVAALISVLALKMTDEPSARALSEGAARQGAGTPAVGSPAKEVRGPGAGAPEAVQGAETGSGPKPSGKDSPAVGAQGPVPAAEASAQTLRDSTPSAKPGEARPGAAEIARGPQAVTASTKDGATAPSAMEIARGPQQGTTAKKDGAATPSATEIARGPREGMAASKDGATTPSAMQVAQGLREGTASTKTGESGPEAPGVARGEVRRKGSLAVAAQGTPDERARKDILSRYESGDVSGALAQARRANLTPLVQQLTGFQTAEAAARTALAKKDRPRALDALISAVRLDQALSQGWSGHGQRLRRQLAGLYVRTGMEAARARRWADAREAFNDALKHDADNAEAREQLAALETQAPQGTPPAP